MDVDRTTLIGRSLRSATYTVTLTAHALHDKWGNPYGGFSGTGYQFATEDLTARGAMLGPASADRALATSSLSNQARLHAPRFTVRDRTNSSVVGEGQNRFG